MSLGLKRGLKFGAANAVIFPFVVALNAWLKKEGISSISLISSAVLGFILFGLISIFTDKVGSDLGG